MTTIRAIVALLGGWRATAFAALLVIAAGLGLWWRADAAVAARKADAATAAAKQANAALRDAQRVIAAERANVEKANKVAEEYEHAKQQADARADALAADLRAGRVKLRDEWRGQATVPAPGSGSAEPDAAEQRRIDGARRAVGAADACDAQVSALQDLLRQERK